MEKKYFSVDVETNGQYPWRSSMLSLGACVIDGKFDKIFYAELKPIREEYESENFRIGASSLQCLRGCNFEKFNPKEVLSALNSSGESPSEIMPKFAEWILKNSVGFRPIIAAAPIKFDGMFIAYYFDLFNKRTDPFGHSGEDIQSVFRGNVRDMKAQIEEFGLRERGELRHNALEDAIQQAKEFYITLVQMRQNK